MDSQSNRDAKHAIEGGQAGHVLGLLRWESNIHHQLKALKGMAIKAAGGTLQWPRANGARRQSLGQKILSPAAAQSHGAEAPAANHVPPRHRLTDSAHKVPTQLILADNT